MGHYIANLRDIEFCLFDLLGRESILGKGIYSDVDRATAMGMLEEVKRLCEMIWRHPLLKVIASEQISTKQLVM